MNLRNVGAVLRDGVRLSLLLGPRRTPLDRGLGTFLLLCLLTAIIAAVWQWMLIEPPRLFNSAGFQARSVGALLTLIAATLLCAICRRRALFWTVAGWLEASSVLPALVTVAVCALGGWEAVFSPWTWGGLLLWGGAIMLRLAWFLTGGKAWRSLAATTLAFGISVLPWYTVLDNAWLWDTDWQAKFAANPDMGDDNGELAEPEATMYGQPERLAAAIESVLPQRPDTIDMYAIAFGGDAGQDVFRNEVEFVEQLFARRFDARGRVLALLNHPGSAATRPLATATNLERSLIALGQRMDPAQDILFLYLTSHGSPEHELYVNQPPLPLDQLTPQRLRHALDASGIRWRVLVVSACYSGGFIDALRDPQTLVITAARADRSSFGCEPESEITWFGHAFMAEAMNQTTDLRAAFELARATIAQREKAEEFDPSEPQWDAGDRILGQLQRWREGFEAGAPVPFAPSDAEAIDASANEKADRAKK